MENKTIQDFKKNIIAIGRLLWEKDIATGLNGNISRRVDDDSIVLTGRGTCLGLLQESDVLHTDLDGKVLEEGTASSETPLHTEIYKHFPQAAAVIHTHTAYTNAYFLHNKTLIPQIFESKLYLGTIECVDQDTPTVTDVAPVIKALEKNNIVVLRHHGVIAKGEELFDCFLLIQALEEAVKIDAVSRLYAQGATTGLQKDEGAPESKKYKLFSQEQIDDIVKIVNEDKQMQELGSKTGMTMDLAVQLQETGATYSFSFENGKITSVGNDTNAEFLITAPEDIWRAVFNRQIDPFVATTQKKMDLKGDFAKISKWYAPCSRIFELWGAVPVE